MHSLELFHCLFGWMDGAHTRTHIFAIPSFAWPCHLPLILFEYLQFYKVKKIENDDGRESEWHEHIKKRLKRMKPKRKAGATEWGHTMCVYK